MRNEIKIRLDETIVYLYNNFLRESAFPIEPKLIIDRLDGCGYISYASLSRKSGKSIDEIVSAFKSQDGCTHFDIKNNRYLMTINEYGRSKARIRWTIAHELGHISAGHFIELADNETSEKSQHPTPYMEEEADYFAASLLAPIPAIKAFRARCADDIRKIFGLSIAASNYRWSEYRRHADESSELDDFFAEVARKTWRDNQHLILRKPIDVWADHEL